MNTLSFAKSLFEASRISGTSYDVRDYGRLPMDAPERLSSPADQKKNLMILLNTAPLTREWVSSKILSGFYKMENSPLFVAKFPQVAKLSRSLNPVKMDLFRRGVESLSPEDVGGDFSDISMFVQKARKMLEVLRETISKMPKDIQDIERWVEHIEKVCTSFSGIIDEGIKEVRHAKSSVNK